MDEAERETLLVKLNKINYILEERVFIVNKDIESQNFLIEQDKNKLQLVTGELVINSEEIVETNKEKEKITCDMVKIESEMKDMRSEIDKGVAEVESLSSQIESHKPKNDALDILNIIINPIGSIVSDIGALNAINDLKGKINNLGNELGKKSSNYEELDQKRIQIDMKLRDTEGKGIYLNEQRVELETKLRELGIQKTKNENFKLNLQLLKSKCLQLIDETKQGKELIDNGINLVSEIEDNLKLLYLNNGLTLTL
ncbi:hypothetical protein ACTFIU_009486 [Dictyostelium citrinum]